MTTLHKRQWVIDYETIVNCTIVCIEDYGSNERGEFIINRHVNHMPELIQFLEECVASNSWHFGFNNIHFDGQITQFIYQNRHLFRTMTNTDDITNKIYDFAQDVIQKSRNNERPVYPEWKQNIRQLDIFKLNHWDNKAKSASLKWIQYTMDWKNVEEMPHPHYQPVLDDDTLFKLVDYCRNDVASTKAIINYKDKKGKFPMKEGIMLRKELSEKYDLNLYSASEPKISKEVFLHLLSEQTRIDKRTLRDSRTHRTHVRIADVILPYVKFETPEFQKIHDWFKEQVVEIDEEVSADEREIAGPKFVMHHAGVKTVFGLGGIHGCTTSGIYRKGNGRIIKSADVTSFYPNLAIRNKWSPAHLNKEMFCNLYEWMFEERKKYAKGTALNYLYKIILNATYGLSKERNSFLYDPELTFKITVNGQLLLAMLYEQVMIQIPDAIPLMQNTDGLEFSIPMEFEEKFNNICKDWETMTNLELEFEEYKKLIIGDVNNYIGEFISGKTKCKGRFEYEDLALHKNKSFAVIPKAIYEYFINGVDPEEYLESNNHIFDYCGGVKVKGAWELRARYVIKGEYKDEPLQKMMRYYISTKGMKLYKVHPDGRAMQIESGKWLTTGFNNAQGHETRSFESFDIDKSYYLEKIKQEIAKIESSDTTIQPLQFQLF
jgi:hypothetical protein